MEGWETEIERGITGADIRIKIYFLQVYRKCKSHICFTYEGREGLCKSGLNCYAEDAAVKVFQNKKHV